MARGKRKDKKNGKKDKVIDERKLLKRQARLERKRQREAEAGIIHEPETHFSSQAAKRQKLLAKEPKDKSDVVLAESQETGTVAEPISGEAGDDFISLDVGKAKSLKRNAATMESDAEEEEQEMNEGLENRPFYGLLTTEEQIYYNKVGHKLTIDDFETNEDRAIFVEAVFQEAQGKELKLATSKACSRAFQRLMLEMNVDQIRSCFLKYLGNLNALVQHRFGSHFMETVFLKAAEYVVVDESVDELVDMKKKKKRKHDDDEKESMESLLLKAAEELEPNIGYLLTDRFSSHSIRCLFLVLSHEPLDDPAAKVISLKKRREKHDMSMLEGSQDLQKRPVPKSFRPALDRLVSSATSNMDTTGLRVLASHQSGNPVLQLLVRLELASTTKAKNLDENSIFRRLFPDESLDPDTESAKFLVSLLYDAAGSRLVEILVQKSPAKIFKKLYKNILKERMGQTARNEIATYVNQRVLERLGKDDLIESMELILPEAARLISQRRTAVIKVLINRAVAREVDLTPIAEAIKAACDDDTKAVLRKLLNLQPAPTIFRSKKQRAILGDIEQESYALPAKPDVHGSLLAQSMLQAPITNEIIQEGLLDLSPKLRLAVATNPVTCHVVQAALTSRLSSTAFKKLLISSYFGCVADLSVDQAGSHFADMIWDGTQGQHFLKERFAQELAENETRIRESSYGRIVWRNWEMDLYRSRPAEWQAIARGKNSDLDDGGAGGESRKAPIEIARERHFKMNQARMAQHLPPQGNAVKV